jgi:Uma2 family endonuclease
MSSGPTAPRRTGTATALRAVPATHRGEILEGQLFVQLKEDESQRAIESALLTALRAPFQRGRGGPGGWWFVQEGRIKVGESDFSPDVSGWHAERVPTRPLARDKVAVVPDWICEVHSAATRGYDFLVKRAFYASLGVSTLWFVDPQARTLFVSKLLRGRWCDVGVYGDDDEVRVEPFEEHSVKCAEWWSASAREAER